MNHQPMEHAEHTEMETKPIDSSVYSVGHYSVIDGY